MASHYATHLAATAYDDEWQDEPLPFYSLSQDDFNTMRPSPGPSRVHAREKSPAYRRQPYRSGSPTPMSFSTPTKKVVKRPKQRLRRKMRSQSPSPSPTPGHYAYQYPPLLPPLPYVPAPPMAYYQTPGRRQPPPAPQYAPPPGRQWSLLGLLSPSLPLLFMVIFGSLGLAAVSLMLHPLTRGFGDVISSFSRINPAEIVGAIVNPIANIPVTDVWCKAIGIGCGPGYHAAFKTDTFMSLKRPHSTEDISIGTDFFDCLDDLRITRQQEVATSHLVTLSAKVMQFEHILAAPEEIRDNLDGLAKIRKEFLFNANTARVTGSTGVGKIVNEYHRFRDLSSSLTPSDVSAGLAPAREDLASAASFTLSSAQAVKEAEEVATMILRQAHSEISRLHNIQNNQESGLGYLAYGWTEPSWKLLQPGLVGRKEQRKEAALFLKEVVRVIDESVMPMIRNGMSLQQCAINTNDFNYKMERAFSLQESSWTLSIDGQLKRLAPRIESLDSKLGQLKKKDEAAKLALAGIGSSAPPSLPPPPPPPPALPPVPPMASLEGGREEISAQVEAVE
ncbi:hypothetical protein FRB90_003065 [Tulasnella sp. 427]|nr:hypothetical protein FRB90_003065 [Tulasnella sp. 427]